ncbi:hypothetical protein [Ethanoligenens sp.]|uniref:hypothetical protein n=1 Tax=Ethanoligenens sp. TaxID=2099655 RepID=UPI0039E9E3F8
MDMIVKGVPERIYNRLCKLAKMAGYSDIGDFTLQIVQIQMLADEIQEQNLLPWQVGKMIDEAYAGFEAGTFKNGGRKNG